MLKKAKSNLSKISLGIILSLSGLCLHQMAHAQEEAINKPFDFRIDESLDLKGLYVINADEFNFESQQEALDFFRELRCEYVAFRPMINDGIVNMYLQLKKKPEWTASQWNNYLANIFTLKAEKYTSVTD